MLLLVYKIRSENLYPSFFYLKCGSFFPEYKISKLLQEVQICILIIALDNFVNAEIFQILF